MAELKTRIQLRHDTEENWTLVGESLVPLAGEACLTIDGENKGRVKYGDGTSTWAELEYTGLPNELDVDASEVSFADDMVFTYQFGKYAPDSSGQVEIPATGKTLEQLLMDAFAEEKNPTTTQPSASVSSSQVKAYEVGTNVTVQYNASLNPGNYQYGPATGVTATTYNVTFNSESRDTATGSFTEITVGDDTNLRVQAQIGHTAGAVPVTNLGKEYAAGQIQEGTKSAQTGAITGYRQAFWGVDTTSGAIDSALIRGLTASNGAAGGRTVTINAKAGATRIIVAVPQSSGLKVNSAILTTSMNADITSNYVKQAAPVNVEGANAYTAAPYDVYVYQPASIDPSEVHQVTIGR